MGCAGAADGSDRGASGVLAPRAGRRGAIDLVDDAAPIRTRGAVAAAPEPGAVGITA